MDSALASASSDVRAVESFCVRALALRHSDRAAARELAERALADARERGDDALVRRATATLGACLAAATELPRARELLEAALAQCDASGDAWTRCEVLNELSELRAATYDFERARGFSAEAEEAARTLGRRDEEARALRVQGRIDAATGEFAQALARLLRALELQETVAAGREGAPTDEERWERGELFGCIGVVYSNMDQFRRSLDYYHVALESFGDRFPLAAAKTLYRMGIAAEEGGLSRASAGGWYRGALELFEREGDATGAALGRIGLAKVLLDAGDAEEAERNARQACEALRGVPSAAGFYSDALWALGDALLHRGRADEALAHYQDAHSRYAQLGRPGSHEAHLCRRLANACAALGRYEEAYRHLERHAELAMQHLKEQADARMAATMAQFDTERALKDREIHRLRTIELEREIAERREAEAALAAARAELEQRNRELHALTIRDPLTGAFNRRYLDQRLAEVLPLAVRGAQPLALMICDIDDFKRVNDTWTHAVGDEVLCAVAAILRQNVRQSDVAARLGGEEFVVLFPCATLEQAAAASEKIRRLVAEWAWDSIAPGLELTISAGVAQADAHSSPEQLLAQADARLYQAKRRGKDCVVAAEG